MVEEIVFFTTIVAGQEISRSTMKFKKKGISLEAKEIWKQFGLIAQQHEEKQKKRTNKNIIIHLKL